MYLKEHLHSTLFNILGMIHNALLRILVLVVPCFFIGISKSSLIIWELKLLSCKIFESIFTQDSSQPLEWFVIPVAHKWILDASSRPSFIVLSWEFYIWMNSLHHYLLRALFGSFPKPNKMLNEQATLFRKESCLKSNSKLLPLSELSLDFVLNLTYNLFRYIPIFNSK